MINQKKNSNVNKKIRFKTPTLRSNLCDYSDAYIVVKKRYYCYCLSKINGVKIDNAENIDTVMLMYDLLECSKNHIKTAGSSWNYYRDEPSNRLPSSSKSFKHQTSIAGNT